MAAFRWRLPMNPLGHIVSLMSSMSINMAALQPTSSPQINTSFKKTKILNIKINAMPLLQE
jgi:hypothetical protein